MAIGAALIATAALAHACKEPTQVTLDIRSSNDCSALRGVHIGVAGMPAEAEGRIGAFLSAEAPKCDPGVREIGTLVLTPGESGRAAVIIVAGVSSDVKECLRPDYKGCVVARRSLSFVESRPLVVPILIDFACKDVPCDVDTTCKNGECISAELLCDEEGCIPKDPRGRDDAGGSSDATTNDGSPTSDAPSDNNVAPEADSTAPTDATVDATLPPSCPHLCPSGGPCPQNEACCYGMNRTPTCKSVFACHTPATSPPGVSACCAHSQDCSVGNPGLAFCCAQYETKSPFKAVATCFSTPCSGANVVQLCITAGECFGGKTCRPCDELGYTGSSLSCCGPI